MEVLHSGPFYWCARQGAHLGSDPEMGSLLQTRSGELLAGRQGCPSRGGIRRKPQAKHWTDEQEAHEAEAWGEAANIAKAHTDTEHADVYATVISVKGVRITRRDLAGCR
jgi:hypothetical protein